MLPNQVWTVKPKLIYVSRDAKDVAISKYHIYKAVYDPSVKLTDYLEAFLKDQVLFSPFREHRVDYWNIRNYENILFITYEEMIRDIDASILKVGNFLGKTITNENFTKLKNHLTFDSMKSKKKFEFLYCK